MSQPTSLTGSPLIRLLTTPPQLYRPGSVASYIVMIKSTESPPVFTNLDVVDEGDDRVVCWAAGCEGMAGPGVQRDTSLLSQRVDRLLSTAERKVIISTRKFN